MINKLKILLNASVVFAARCGLGVYSYVFGHRGACKGARLKLPPSGALEDERWSGPSCFCNLSALSFGGFTFPVDPRHLVASVSPNLDHGDGPFHF